MYCIKCNAELQDGFIFCPYCGKKQITEKKKVTKHRGNGTGTVVRQPNGTWKAIVTLKYYVDEQGNPKRITRTKSGFKTKKEALQVLDTLRTYVAPINEKITLEELYKEWLPLHSPKITRGTLSCYKSAYLHIKPLYYEQFSHLRTEHWQNCVDNCTTGKRTMQNIKTLAGLLYKYAMQKDLVDRNYGEYIFIPKIEQKQREAFTTSDIKRLFETAKTHDGAKLVLCLIYTGFRLEEFLTLKKSQYFTSEGFNYFIGGMKTTAGKNRTVTISPKIQPFVDYFASKNNEYIFSDLQKDRMSQKRFRKDFFYPALELSGISQDFTPHCCRHTFATLMKNVEAPATDKKELIGHSSFEMTAHYTHTDFESLKQITDKI